MKTICGGSALISPEPEYGLPERRSRLFLRIRGRQREIKKGPRRQLKNIIHNIIKSKSGACERLKIKWYDGTMIQQLHTILQGIESNMHTTIFSETQIVYHEGKMVQRRMNLLRILPQYEPFESFKSCELERREYRAVESTVEPKNENIRKKMAGIKASNRGKQMGGAHHRHVARCQPAFKTSLFCLFD